jgi:hypothetical protein
MMGGLAPSLAGESTIVTSNTGFLIRVWAYQSYVDLLYVPMTCDNKGWRIAKPLLDV